MQIIFKTIIRFISFNTYKNIIRVGILYLNCYWDKFNRKNISITKFLIKWSSV